ncbi:MAG TPA: family 10 glycosylhydrolase [Gemmatimonadaceae bacterium]|nr:family 10 glycosylhydrolase [Gemmatimonadaceae bacterium]
MSLLPLRPLARLAAALLLAAPALSAQTATPPAASSPAASSWAASSGAPAPAASPADEPPPVPREFRAAWVASVANIDWPSKPGLSTWQQQAELTAILDRAVALRLNAIILQVRPAADALYRSSLEPWSEYLTGEMGRAPEPAWDPLAFAVEAAHARGLELHAWFNPYRAHHAAGTRDFSTNHVSRSKPGIVRQYAGWQWLDPGDPATQAHSLAVILDVVKRYDIDGVHIDDYFYPYRERDASGKEIDFPDSASWARYRRDGGTLSRGDWRRRNVDRFLQRLHAGIRERKPWVRFGVSPFGIWRPGYPESVRGFDAYEQIYADSRKWLVNGWVDYFTPQLYWPIGAPQQSYPALLEWWVKENVKGRHIWPGNYTSRVGSASAKERWSAGELLEQIRRTRLQRGAGGNVHFSMKALMENRDGLADSLAGGLYAMPALVPASRWLDSVAPPRPVVALRRDSIAGGWRVDMRPRGASKVWLWVVRARFGDTWTTEILPGSSRTRTLTSDDALPPPDVVTVVAVDRVGNESPIAPARPPRAQVEAAP